MTIIRKSVIFQTLFVCKFKNIAKRETPSIRVVMVGVVVGWGWFGGGVGVVWWWFGGDVRVVRVGLGVVWGGVGVKFNWPCHIY